MLFLTEKDVQSLTELYSRWLKDAFDYERREGGEITSCLAVLAEVRRVKGKTRPMDVKEWLQGLPLAIPYITYEIVSLSLEVLSSLPLLSSEDDSYVYIENSYGKVFLCHTFTQEDNQELDEFYWNCITDLIFEGAYNEDR